MWTARFLVGEAGGRNNPDNQAVLWTMINLYGLIRNRQYPTFHAFLRAYSTPLQPSLRNWRAAKTACPEARVRENRTHLPTTGTARRPVGQLRQFLRLQNQPWSALPEAARTLATKALTGRLPNPIGNATQFASTAVFFHDRHGRVPKDAEWLQFTREYAKKQRYHWIGQRPGLNQRHNAFFVEDRFAKLPAGAVRVEPPRP